MSGIVTWTCIARHNFGFTRFTLNNFSFDYRLGIKPHLLLVLKFSLGNYCIISLALMKSAGGKNCIDVLKGETDIDIFCNCDSQVVPCQKLVCC